MLRRILTLTGLIACLAVVMALAHDARPAMALQINGDSTTVTDNATNTPEALSAQVAMWNDSTAFENSGTTFRIVGNYDVGARAATDTATNTMFKETAATAPSEGNLALKCPLQIVGFNFHDATLPEVASPRPAGVHLATTVTHNDLVIAFNGDGTTAGGGMLADGAGASTGGGRMPNSIAMGVGTGTAGG